ncbi:MAG: Ig-like domain-containing protein, partial [Myxococcales bacterium]|nr:Ig-like domain-containing protein [Myxococcales bacterium]
WLGEVTSNGNGGYVFVHEDYAYVGESDFAAIYDVSDLSMITEVARMDLVGDLDTVTPIGNLAVLSVDDKAELDKATAIAPARTTPDENPPVALWSWPRDGATGLAVTSRFGISMNEMVDVKSAFDGSVRLYETDVAPEFGRVDGVFSVQENIVNFWPEAPLKPGTSYTLELPAGGLLDYSGNALAVPFKATFKTAGAAQ